MKKIRLQERRKTGPGGRIRIRGRSRGRSRSRISGRSKGRSRGRSRNRSMKSDRGRSREVKCIGVGISIGLWLIPCKKSKKNPTDLTTLYL